MPIRESGSLDTKQEAQERGNNRLLSVSMHSVSSVLDAQINSSFASRNINANTASRFSTDLTHPITILGMDLFGFLTSIWVELRSRGPLSGRISCWAPRIPLEPSAWSSQISMRHREWREMACRPPPDRAPSLPRYIKKQWRDSKCS